MVRREERAVAVTLVYPAMCIGLRSFGDRAMACISRGIPLQCEQIRPSALSRDRIK